MIDQCMQFYIFNREGRILYYKQLNEDARNKPADLLPNLCQQLNITIKSFNQDDYLENFETSDYKCHVFFTQTGYWFVLFTVLTSNSYQKQLAQFYSEVFIKLQLHDIECNIQDGKFSEAFDKAVQTFWNQQ